LDSISEDSTNFFSMFGSFGRKVYTPDTLLYKQVKDEYFKLFSYLQKDTANPLDGADLYYKWLNLAKLSILLGDIAQLNKNYDKAVEMYTIALRMDSTLNLNKGLKEQIFISRALMYRYLNERGKMNLDVDSALNINRESDAIYVRYPTKYWDRVVEIMKEIMAKENYKDYGNKK